VVGGASGDRTGFTKRAAHFAAGEYRRLSANFAILHQIIFYDGEGDWHEINAAGPKIQAVTADDVKRVANKYFTRENRTVAIYTRKAGVAPAEKPQSTTPSMTSR